MPRAASGTSTWSAQVPLSQGVNRVLVQASGADGRIATAERLVRYLPAGLLGISQLAESAPSSARWDMLAVTFALDNSTATDTQFPYDPAPPPGLEWVDGVSVDGLFTPDNWQTDLSAAGVPRPVLASARSKNERGVDLSASARAGLDRCALRRPPTGNWSYRIEVNEAKRQGAVDAERTFTRGRVQLTRLTHGPARGGSSTIRAISSMPTARPSWEARHWHGFLPERYLL